MKFPTKEWTWIFIVAATIIAGSLVLFIGSLIVTYIVVDRRGWIHLAELMGEDLHLFFKWSPYLAMGACLLSLVYHYLLPIGKALPGIFQSWIEAFGQFQRNHAWVGAEGHTVVNRARNPFLEVHTTKTIQERVDGPGQGVLPPPAAANKAIWDAKNVLAALLNIAQQNQERVHVEKIWLLAKDYYSGELIYAEFMNEFLSTIVGGQPRFGKTSFVVWIILNILACSGKIYLFDPHLHHPTLSLYKRLEPMAKYGSRFFMQDPCDPFREKSIIEQFAKVDQEYERRHNSGGFTNGKEDHLIVIVIDEFAELLSMIHSAAARNYCAGVIAKIITSANKFGMITLIISQHWLVSETGGSHIRDNSAGRICFFHTDTQMELTLNVRQGRRKALDDLLGTELLRGQAIVRRSGVGLQRVIVPFVTPDDVESFCASLIRMQPDIQPPPMSAIWDEPLPPPVVHVPPLDTFTRPVLDEPEREEENEELTPQAARDARELTKEQLELVHEEAMRMMREDRFVRRKLLQKRLHIHGTQYNSMMRYLDTQGFPRRLEEDITKEDWEAYCASFDHCCVSCGRQAPFMETAPWINLEKDHVLPTGPYTLDNLQPLCRTCNNKKGGRHNDGRAHAQDFRPAWREKQQRENLLTTNS